jgi:hypothetical protein
MMRRDVVPKPPVVLGLVLECTLVALVGRGLREGLAEDFVNWISGVVRLRSHKNPEV